MSRRASKAEAAEITRQNLTDLGNEHRLPESGDPATATEREQIAPWADYHDPAILAVFRAGWDQGVADRARRSSVDELAHVKVGDPDPTGDDGDCPGRHGPYWCTRVAGHVGQHIAAGMSDVIAVWPPEASS